MARTPKTASAAASADEANSGNSSGEFEWSAPKQSASTLPNDPHMPYALPQWLVPERYKDKQSSQNQCQARIFSVPLPEVEPKTKQAVRTYLVKNFPQQKSGMKDSERKLKELKLEEKQASTKAKAAKDKLAQALFTRSEKLKEIRKAHELETQAAMEELETKMREEHSKKNSQLEEKIQNECKLEYEKKFEEEMVHKRKRDQEEDEKEEQAAAKKAKETKDEITTKTTTTTTTSSGEASEHDNAKTTDTLSKVEALEKKREDLKQEMEKLSEKKKEFYWLLKQVIKQEAMQKMKLAKLKKAAEAK